MKKITLITLFLIAFSFQSYSNNLVVGQPTINGTTAGM